MVVTVGLLKVVSISFFILIKVYSCVVEDFKKHCIKYELERIKIAEVRVHRRVGLLGLNWI
jgi:hypothetical protein